MERGIVGWLLLVLAAYLLGSFPSGYLVVRFTTGKDVRKRYSGRTGGTNALRSAGFAAGLVTAVSDMGKALVAVWLAKTAYPDLATVHAAAGIAAIVGHNYSAFLIQREDGRLKFSGGAGGAPMVGAAIGLWPPSGLIIVPLGVLIMYLVGYASLATMTTGIAAAAIFAWRAWGWNSPWAYAAFGVAAELILIWALRPNIRRLLRGEERLVGLRSKIRSKPEGDAARSP